MVNSTKNFPQLFILRLKCESAIMLVFYSIFISSVFLHRHIPDAADDQTSSLFNDKLNLFPIITKQLDACTLRGLREGRERKSSFCISRRGFVISNMVFTYPSIW